MEDIVKRFCRDDKTETGLLLIDCPTGTGKTHSVLEYIADTLIDESKLPRSERTQFVFTTPVKKNLPHKKLCSLLEDRGYPDLCKEVLFLRPNDELVTEGLKKNPCLPEEIRQRKEYRRLEKSVKAWEEYKVYPEVREVVKAELVNAEREFRKKLRAKLSKAYPTSKDRRLKALRTEKEWKWVGELYPSVFTGEKQVIFLSVKKLLFPHDTLIEPASRLIDSPLLKNAVIFVDEFDSSKGDILDFLIDEGLKTKVDIVSMFIRIYEALTRPQHLKDINLTDKEQAWIEGNRTRARELYEKWHIDSAFKLAENQIEAERNFMFNDYAYRSIFKGAQYVDVKYDGVINRIIAADRGVDNGEHANSSLNLLLGELRGFLAYFSNCVAWIATGYQSRHNIGVKHRNNEQFELAIEDPTVELRLEEEMGFDAAVRTILSRFDFKRDEAKHEFLLRNVLDYYPRQHASQESEEESNNYTPYDHSFYAQGFRYYEFIDSIDHKLETQIITAFCRDTPEKVLLKLCERAKVVGISATATIDTMTDNYNTDYLRWKLGPRFSEITIDERARLKKMFEESTSRYDKVEIIAERIDSNSAETENPWLSVFNDPKTAEEALIKIESLCPKKNHEFNRTRYVRIAKAYSKFIDHDDIRSLLCLLTTYPKDPAAGSSISRNALEELFSWIVSDRGLARTKEESFAYMKKTWVVLDGKDEEFEANKERILQRLSEGEKLFVVSVYQSIGAGQNLQYLIPSNIEPPEIINDTGRIDKEKDFDAIYLEKPTHVMPILDESGLEDREKLFLKYIYTIEFLFNSRRELDAEQAKRAVLYAFRWLGMHGYDDDWRPKLSITESAKYSIARTIIQAVGRICRTNRKSKRIYVFAADELCSSLDKQMFEDMGLQYNPEFKALIELFEGGSGCKEENRNAWNDAVLNVSRVRINALLNNIQNGPTKKNMESWEGLREVSLRNDTTNPHNPYVTDFYCKFENPKRRYWYTQSEDYKYTQIFDKPEPGAIEVSAEAARLDQLMKIPGLRACFEEKKWATDWVESRFLMSPIMFNNIYKGALGEVVGRFIFESVGLTLSPITEAAHFEKFDYILTSHGTGDVFVDFKLWKPMTDFNNAEMLEKITEKMRVVGARKVIVANILDDGNGRNEPKIWPLGDDVEQGGIFVLPSLITPDKLVDREVMGRVLEWAND